MRSTPPSPPACPAELAQKLRRRHPWATACPSNPRSLCELLEAADSRCPGGLWAALLLRYSRPCHPPASHQPMSPFPVSLGSGFSRPSPQPSLSIRASVLWALPHRAAPPSRGSSPPTASTLPLLLSPTTTHQTQRTTSRFIINLCGHPGLVPLLTWLSVVALPPAPALHSPGTPATSHCPVLAGSPVPPGADVLSPDRSERVCPLDSHQALSRRLL